MQKILKSLVAVYFLIITSNANACLKGDLKKATQNYVETNSLNAIYSVNKGDTNLLKGVHGYFSFEKKKKLTGEEVMPIASGTKQMTAAIILKLQEQGKLKVSDKIVKFFNENAEIWKGDMPDWAKKITIHHLLTHTSGLKEYYNDVVITDKMDHHTINQGIIDFSKSKGLDFNPGKKYQYSNTGYVFLGLIIEKVVGKDIITCFNEELLGTLNLKHTHLANLKEAFDFQKGKLKSYPTRYFTIPNNTNKPQFVKVGPEKLLSPYADGGVVSNLDEIQTWIQALHNGKVLSAKSYAMMVKPYVKVGNVDGVETHMGYGMFINKLSKGEKVYSHGGRAIGIRGEFVYIPASKVSIAIISNSMLYEPEEIKGKIDYSLKENQVDIKYFKDVLVKTAEKYIGK